jgi:hypothetical protein
MSPIVGAVERRCRCTAAVAADRLGCSRRDGWGGMDSDGVVAARVRGRQKGRGRYNGKIRILPVLRGAQSFISTLDHVPSLSSVFFQSSRFYS